MNELEFLPGQACLRKVSKPAQSTKLCLLCCHFLHWHNCAVYLVVAKKSRDWPQGSRLASWLWHLRRLLTALAALALSKRYPNVWPKSKVLTFKFGHITWVKPVSRAGGFCVKSTLLQNPSHLQILPVIGYHLQQEPLNTNRIARSIKIIEGKHYPDTLCHWGGAARQGSTTWSIGGSSRITDSINTKRKVRPDPL